MTKKLNFTFMKKIFSILLLLFSAFIFPQLSKVHYLPPICASTETPNAQYIYISTPSLVNVNFVLKFANGTIATSGTFTKNTPFVYNIGSGTDTQIMLSSNGAGQILNNKGYIIEADSPVYVCVRLTASLTNNQAGSIVSKGQAAIGKRFRVGAFRNTGISSITNRILTFASILALENNTTIKFSDIKNGVTLINNAAVGNNPPDVVLNQGQSYIIAVEGPNDANKDGLIGALLASDKEIVVNCGSFTGSNGTSPNAVDIGMDQIVPAERTGTEYIFIKGGGNDNTESPLIVADVNNTQVFLNGSTTAVTTLQAGEYLALSGTNFSPNDNLYVKTSEKVFAYQGIGGRSYDPNQNMHFVPPINCATPKFIDNIPIIHKIGNLDDFTATVCIFTEVGSILTFNVEGTQYSLSELASLLNINAIQPKTVLGNSQFVTYKIGGLTGSISIFSTTQLYLSYYGSNVNATYGGFYSGFTFAPEISFNNLSATQTGCIPNVKLEVKSVASYDNFEWYQNTLPTGVNIGLYTPTSPGYYFAIGKINSCGSLQEFKSDLIPVSICTPDSDNDGINNNIDVDLDNDGIPNCTESFGDKNINTSNLSAGNINFNSYSNSFSGNTTTKGTAIPVGSVSGNANGFVTQVPIGKKNEVTYKMTFNKPISVAIVYPLVANTSDLINSESNFIANSDLNSTLTVLNPSNQLLIDTNYDGIYESGITRFSSFEIRFRLNSATPLAAGTGTFSFRGNLINSISITQENLSETAINRATFAVIATCIPRDIDGDGVFDLYDLDSDNDGISDNIEFVSQNNVVKSNADINFDGLDDAFDVVTAPSDYDNDNVSNFLDIDSDNDGIYDLVESGSSAVDANLDGIVDGNAASFGTNGLSNSLETVIDNGVLNYTIQKTDIDIFPNYVDLDSDQDECFDVIEAGFLDSNLDGYVGGLSISVDSNGKVNFVTAYTNPNPRYLISGLITITTQPENQEKCNLENATFLIETNTVNSYKWQVSIDNGVTFTNISDNLIYAGSATNSLSLSTIPTTYNGYKYRVYINNVNNICGKYSNIVNLIVNKLPVLTIASLVQCDDDFDGITAFNLDKNKNSISVNSVNETFSFFRTELGAKNNSTSLIDLIEKPENFISNTAIIWVRVTNAKSCFSVIQLNLTVTIPPANLSNYPKIIINKCDDFLDKNGENNINNSDTDGITRFDMSSAVETIRTRLTNPANYNIKLYKTKADALQEKDVLGISLEISDITNFRNKDFPNQQEIWIRVENTVNNTCFGVGNYLTLMVDKLPNISLTGTDLVCLNEPNVFKTLTAGILDNTLTSAYDYVWTKDNVVLSNINSTLGVNLPGIYTVKVITKPGLCFRTRTITVAKSEAAIFLPPTINDLTENPSVTINTTGIGNYEYSLDSQYGPFQSSSTFINMSYGTHEVFVNDTQKCGIVSQIINIIGAPKFFTPNGDGANDFWNVSGTTLLNNYNSKVSIFDRFGKLISIFNTFDQGWNGNFNNQPLPSDDYWFVAELEDGRVAKGNFALKR